MQSQRPSSVPLRIEGPRQPRATVVDGLTPACKGAGGTARSVEPVEGVVGGRLGADAVEVLPEARLGACDGHQEGGIDAVTLTGGAEGCTFAGKRRALGQQEGVDLLRGCDGLGERWRDSHSQQERHHQRQAQARHAVRRCRIFL